VITLVQQEKKGTMHDDCTEYVNTCSNVQKEKMKTVRYEMTTQSMWTLVQTCRRKKWKQ